MSSDSPTGTRHLFRGALYASVSLSLALASAQVASANDYLLSDPLSEEPVTVHGAQLDGEQTSGPTPDPWSALMVGGTGIALSALAIAVGGTGGGSGGGSDDGSGGPDDPQDPPGSGLASSAHTASFDRASAGDMAGLMSNAHQDNRRSAMHRMRLFGGIEERSVQRVEAGPLSVTTSTRLRADGAGLGPSSYASMTFGFAGDGYVVEGSVNPNAGRDFGFREAGFGRSALMDASSFEQPHLALMETGYGGSFGVGLSQSSDLRVAAFSGEVEAERTPGFNTPSLFGGVGEITTDLSDAVMMKASLGAISEEGSLLGSVSRSAFGDDIRANTVFANIGGTMALGQTTSLTLVGALGQTSFNQGSGMVTGGDDIVTSSFGVGLHHAGLFDEQDSFNLALSQPLRVESGGFNLSVPAGHSLDGPLGYRTTSLSADPSGREINLQASYGFNLMEGIQASLGAMHRFDANHVRGKQETIGMVTTSFRF